MHAYPRSQAPPQLFVAYCMRQKAGEEPGNKAMHAHALSSSVLDIIFVPAAGCSGWLSNSVCLFFSLKLKITLVEDIPTRLDHKTTENS